MSVEPSVDAFFPTNKFVQGNAKLLANRAVIAMIMNFLMLYLIVNKIKYSFVVKILFFV